MIMKFSETIRRLMGWCPMAGSVRMDLSVRPAAAAAAGGRDGLFRAGAGWWRHYHNQLLVMALAVSAVAAAFFTLVEDASGYPAVWMGLAIGAGAVIGFLLGCRKQYAQIAAGEFRRENMSRQLRITRELSVPVAFILLLALMAYLLQEGLFDQILGFMLGLSLAFWALYGITVLWERRHQATLIAEKGSMYVVDMERSEEEIV